MMKAPFRLRNVPTDRRAAPVVLALAALLTACASPRPAAPPAPMSSCRSGDVHLDARFEGGQLGQCQPLGGNRFALTLHPEDAPPINVSPWYAFRASGLAGDELVVRMDFPDGYARYWPKISENGRDWTPVPAARVRTDDEGKRMTLDLELPGPWLWVAGQEVLADDWFRAWNRQLDALPHADTRLAGSSREGRPIYVTETADRDEFILLVGRQHPPEVTGSLTFRPFLEVVLGDSELARRFRDRFKLVIYPLLNPDGVARGHWRHNTGGVDLNRDWGPFTQPETRLVRDHVDSLVEQGLTPSLMLDFHSTKSNLFYTQLASEPTRPEAFATRWLAAASERLPGYVFTHEPSGVSERPTTKNYFYTRFGIPAITYETGDETDRAAIGRSAAVFAEEMMRLMLASPRP